MLIGELAQRSGVSARMLRYYDTIGLLSASDRSPSGYREYSEADVQRLLHVEGLKSLGLSLGEIAEVLADLSFSPDDLMARLIERTRDRLAREQELLGTLKRVRGGQARDWSDVLRTIALVRGLGHASPSGRQRVVLGWPGAEAPDVRVLAEAALSEADPIVAGALHWALRRAGDEAVPLLADGVRSAEVGRRRNAVAALAKVGSPAAVAALAEALDDADPLVRGRAALVAGGHGATAAIPALVDLVVSGPDDVAAATVLGALARDTGAGDAIAAAIESRLAEADAPTRQRLAEALAELPGERAQAVLTALSEDEDKSVAMTAAFLLQQRAPAPRP